jgi:hypothetical protein
MDGPARMAALFKCGARGRPYRRPMFASLTTHSTGMPSIDARDDFMRARRAHLAARTARWLARRRRPNHPRTLPEAAAYSGRTARCEVIAIGAIVGTVEPSPHFDERFRPASGHLRTRWERVALAHRRGISLPPIAVVQGPDGYYVIDGRHRVSVARAAGRREIEAWVK